MRTSSWTRWRWSDLRTAIYFTRKAFSVAKLGIAEDPDFQLDKMAMVRSSNCHL
ncbi:hypothetical protein WA852_34290, partial [Pseudomonas aeruginosa]